MKLNRGKSADDDLTYRLIDKQRLIAVRGMRSESIYGFKLRKQKQFSHPNTKLNFLLLHDAINCKNNNNNMKQPCAYFFFKAFQFKNFC